MKAFALFAAAALAMVLVACAHTPPPRPVQTVTQTVEVPVRAPCPAPDEAARLAKLRPAPLRNSPMPESIAERVARVVAQLGRYEASGAWADQVQAALDRCQKP